MTGIINVSNRTKDLAEIFGINLTQVRQNESATNLLKQGMKIQFYVENCQSAIAFYEEAVTLSPNFWEAWLLQGIALCQVGRFHAAIQCFTKTLELQPNPTATLSALNGQAFALQQLGRLKEALAVYNKALQIKPNDEGTLTNRNRVLKQLLLR